MINWSKIPIGKTFKPHYHQDMEEVFIILSGKAKISINDEEAVLKKGDTVIIPAKKIHKMENICQGEVEYLAIGITQKEGGKTIVVE